MTLPDLQILVPTNDISIGTNPTTGDRQLQFTHITWDAGAGPFRITPTVNKATGTSSFTQTIYDSSIPGRWAIDYKVPLVDHGVFISPSDYRYPLTRFTLNQENADGSPGAVVTTSPKVDYCITADTYVGGVPHTPSQTSPPQSNCTSANAALGFSVGWGDEYDQTDNGQPIDLTGVPDGTYVLQATVDPHHIFTESNTANDVVDTTIEVTGSSVTVLNQTSPSVVPPTVAVTSPAAGSTISGTVQLEASASATLPATISNVQYLLDGQPLGAPVNTAPFALSWDTVTTTPGIHTISAEATDSNGTVDTAAPVSVTVTPTPCSGFCVDGLATVNGSSAASVSMSTTTAGDVLVAFVSGDGPTSTAQHATVTATGLTWHLVQRANAQAGTAEIWTTTAPGALTKLSIASHLASTGYHQKLTVLAYRGADGVGASSTASAPSGAPSITLTSTAAGSTMLAVGTDWDNAEARTLGTDQSMVSQWLDSVSGNTMWVQQTATPTTSSGTPVTLDDTAPTSDRWDLAAVEIVPVPLPQATPVVHVTNPSAAETVSGTIAVGATVDSQGPIRSVQFLVDNNPIGKALTSPPYVTRWNTALAGDGIHALSTEVTTASGTTSRSPVLTTTSVNPAPPMTCFVLQASAQAQGTGTVWAPRIHTASSDEELFAFVSAEGSARSSRLPVAAVSGGNLSWHLVKRARTAGADAEIWSTQGPDSPGLVRVSSRVPSGVVQHLSVVAMEGVVGPGASAMATGRLTTPALHLSTRGHTSLVFAVGARTSGSPTVAPGSGWVPLNVAARSGLASWTEYTNDPTVGTGSTVALGGESGSASRWAVAAVEMLNGGD